MTRYLPEFKTAAVRMVMAYERQYEASRSETIRKIAAAIGCSAEALRGWLAE